MLVSRYLQPTRLLYLNFYDKEKCASGSYDHSSEDVSLLSLFLSICPRFEYLQEWELISALRTDNVNYECSVMTGVQRAIRNQSVVEQSGPSCSSKKHVLPYLPLHAAKFYLLWNRTKTKIEMEHKM